LKTLGTLHPVRRRSSSNRSVERIWKRLPALQGRAIRIRFLPALTVRGGKLYSRRSCGEPVYAGSYIRKREIILDRDLRGRPHELARILTHELFHFAWVRLGNPARRSYESLLHQEFKRHAGGELGWSAESRKSALPGRSGLTSYRSLRWREYICESFCDTAAWLYSGVRRHSEFTLGVRFKKLRAQWFLETFRNRGISI
jgi:hypothetical protein